MCLEKSDLKKFEYNNAFEYNEYRDKKIYN